MQQLPEVAKIPVIKSTQSGFLGRDIIAVAEKDYLYMLRGIATQEITQQRRLGNEETGKLVDNAKDKNVDEATRSVVAWFADRAALADAIIAARMALYNNGRKVSGRTSGAFKYLYGVGRNSALRPCDPRAIAKSVPNPAALDLYVVAEVAQIRRWQWYGNAGQRTKRNTRNKKLMAFQRATKTKAMKVSASVFEISAKQAQAQFKSVDVNNIYLRVPNLNPRGKTAVDRVPAIKVRMKVRGRGK